MRGLSWIEIAREIGRGRSRSISASTLRGLRTRRVVEGDGVLQMLLWLDRTPESFLPEGVADDTAHILPRSERGQILRFDTKALYASLDRKRAAGGMTWRAVAEQIGISVASIKHLAEGGRTSFPPVMRITRWLAEPAARFTRLSEH